MSRTPSSFDEDQDGGLRTTRAVERISVGLIAKAAEELRRLVFRTGMSKADIVNRAISLYSYIDARTAAGDELLIRSSNGELERIKLL
jgi:hypothetical protein